MSQGKKLLSSSTSMLQSQPPTDFKSTSLPNRPGGVMRKKKRFIAATEQFKKIKRSGSTFISNVPIIGPGSPSPTVIKELPTRKERKIALSLILLGGEGVGKSSLIERYIQKVFYNENEVTIAPKFFARNIYEELDGMKLRIRLQLWDMPGSKLMRPIVESWTQSADIAFILFSLADQTGNSFREAKELGEIALKQSENMVFLIGTKVDEVDASENIQRVMTKQIEDFMNQNKVIYREISSRTGEGIEELFSLLILHTKQKIMLEDQKEPPKWVPDKRVGNCTSCNCSWTVTNRRHHCRKCGDVFCSKCAFKFIPIPQIGKLTPTRVCNKCFDELMTDSS